MIHNCMVVNEIREFISLVQFADVYQLELYYLYFEVVIPTKDKNLRSSRVVAVS